MKQLTTRDLHAGDIMLKFNAGSFVNRIIRWGQALVGLSNADIVHAGLMFDSWYIIESAGPGLVANDMRVQNRPYGYLVFRCRESALAEGAGTCAKMMFDIHARTGALAYNLAGAVGSVIGPPGEAHSRGAMDDLLDRILEGKTSPFFCSQFVVYVYQFVAEQNGMPARSVFPLADAKVPTAKLATLLASHPLFTEVGYVMPNER